MSMGAASEFHFTHKVDYEYTEAGKKIALSLAVGGDSRNIESALSLNSVFVQGMVEFHGGQMRQKCRGRPATD